MRWLSPLESNIKRQGVRTGRFGSVGDWILKTGEFREWQEGEGGVSKAVLFHPGSPGVGKTYLKWRDSVKETNTTDGEGYRFPGYR